MPKTRKDLAELLADMLTPEQMDTLIAKLSDEQHPIHRQVQDLRHNTQQLMDSPQVLEQVQRQDPRPSFQDLQAQVTVIEEVMDAHKQALRHGKANEHEQAAACYARGVEAINQGPIGLTGDREYRLLFLDAAEHARQHPQTVSAEYEQAQREAANKIMDTLGTQHRTCGAAYEAAAATTGAIAQQQHSLQLAKWAHSYLAQAEIAYGRPTNDQASLDKDHLRIADQINTSQQRLDQLSQEQGYNGPDR